MRSQTIHPKGYGAPMRALFALAVFYSAPDTTAPAGFDAPIIAYCIVDPFAAAATIEPLAASAITEPVAFTELT